MVYPHTLSFTWTFKGFSYIENSSPSDKFMVGHKDIASTWYLELRPTGNGADAEYVSLQINCCGYTGNSYTGNIRKVRYTMCIIDAFNNFRYSKSDTLDYFGIYERCGFPRYILRSELISKGLLIADSLTIQCTMEFGSAPQGGNLPQEPQEINFNPEFLDMYLQHKNTDLTIKVKTSEFKTHRFVLTAHSEVFAAMFSHDMKESSTNTVTIDDIEPDVFEELLRFMYSNQVQNLPTLAKELYVCADKYSMSRLKMLCEKGVKENLSINNAFEYLAFANAYNANSLKSIIITYIRANIKNITDHKGWKYLVDHSELIEQVMDCVTSEIDRLVSENIAER